MLHVPNIIFKVEYCEENRLLLAVHQGNRKGTRALLLTHDINKRISAGLNCVHLAAWSGKRKIMQILLQYVMNHGPENFINSCIEGFYLGQGYTALHLAVLKKYRHIVELLVKYGADVNLMLMPSRETPLHLAVRGGNLLIFNHLAKADANMHAINAKGENALHLAVCSEAHCLLHEFISGELLDINAKINSGATAFELAYEHKNVQAITTLLDYDCDINFAVKRIKTIMSKINGFLIEDIIEVLKRHCARLRALNRNYSEMYDSLFFGDRMEDLLAMTGQCLEEMERMKVIKLPGNSSISFYNFFTAPVKRAATYVRQIRHRTFTAFNYHELLPHFSGMVYCKYQLARKRNIKINEFKKRSQKVVGLNKLPDLCMARVISHLDCIELLSAVRAFE